MTLSLQIAVQATNILTINHPIGFIALTHFSRAFTPIVNTATCNDPFVVTIITGLTAIISVLRALGVLATVHGIVMGGLTRMLAFGDERRISESNRTIIEAIVGLIIVLLSVTLGNQIPTWFGLTNHACLIGPSGLSTQG